MISFQDQKEQQNRGEKEKKREVDRPTAVVRPFSCEAATPRRFVQRVPRQLSYGGLRAFSAHGVVSPRVVHADQGHVQSDDWSDDE